VSPLKFPVNRSYIFWNYTRIAEEESF